jgi:hypothetical protein
MAYNHVGDIIAGSTSVSIDIVLRKKADNTELTAIAYNTSGNIASYRRQGASRTAITLATQTVTGAYSSGGFVEIDSTNQPGLYRLDVPDAALATGVDYVDISFVTTSGYAYHERISLTVSALTGLVTQGVAAAIGSTSITLASGASAFADHVLEGATVQITSATTGVGQSRKITGWVSSTQVATIDPAFNTTPTGTIGYEVFGVAPGSTASPYPSDLRSVLGNAVTAATGGILDVNAKNIANVAAVMDANGWLKVDVEDWKGAVAAALPTNFASLVIDGSGRVDVSKIAGTAQTAADVGSLSTEINADVDEIITTLGTPVSSVATDIANVPTNTLGFTFGAAYGSKTLQQILQIIIAMVAGVTAGAGSATETFKTPDGSATVLTIANSSGNRVTVTLS